MFIIPYLHMKSEMNWSPAYQYPCVKCDVVVVLRDRVCWYNYHDFCCWCYHNDWLQGAICLTFKIVIDFMHTGAVSVALVSVCVRSCLAVNDAYVLIFEFLMISCVRTHVSYAELWDGPSDPLRMEILGRALGPMKFVVQSLPASAREARLLSGLLIWVGQNKNNLLYQDIKSCDHVCFRIMVDYASPTSHISVLACFWRNLSSWGIGISILCWEGISGCSAFSSQKFIFGCYPGVVCCVRLIRAVNALGGVIS